MISFLTGFGAVKLDLKTKAKNGVVSDFRIPRTINFWVITDFQ